jgi:hypothetical protein
MKRAIAEWLWRLAILAALCWIGWELDQIHEDMFEPADEQQAEPAAVPST